MINKHKKNYFLKDIIIKKNAYRVKYAIFLGSKCVPFRNKKIDFDLSKSTQLHEIKKN